MTPEVLTIEETATLLKVDVECVRRMCRNRAIPCFKAGKLWRFRRSALDAWMAEQEQCSRPSSRAQEKTQ